MGEQWCDFVKVPIPMRGVPLSRTRSANVLVAELLGRLLVLGLAVLLSVTAISFNLVHWAYKLIDW